MSHMASPELRVKYIKMTPIAELRPHPKNPNKHTPDQIERLAKLIEYQGWRYTINVSNQSGLINTGHARLMAAQLRGWKEVPVSYQDFESDEQEYASMVADNAIAEWAEQSLSQINIDLSDMGPDFDIDLLGIKDFVLEPAEKFEPQCDEDDVPDNTETRAKTGDRWVLGNHVLVCGDSIDMCAIDLLMMGEKAAMVFTDPPYNINYGNIKHPKFKQREIKNDNMSGEEFEQFCKDWAASLLTICDGCFYVWGPPGKDGRIMFKVLDDMLHSSTTIIWNKDRMTLGRGKYQNKYEPCWFGWNKDGTGFVCEDRSITNVWDLKRPSVNDLHPTMKPIELIEIGVDHASKPGQIVVDIFGGSGSTLIACEKLNRKCYMMELDPHYCDVIITRWEKYTGKTAELQTSGPVAEDPQTES